jgi:hypothetical protein
MTIEAKTQIPAEIINDGPMEDCAFAALTIGARLPIAKIATASPFK